MTDPRPWCPMHGWDCNPTPEGCGTRDMFVRELCDCEGVMWLFRPKSRRARHNADCPLAGTRVARAPVAVAPAPEPARAVAPAKRKRGAPLPGQIGLALVREP